MNREVHVRIWERLEVRVLRATRRYLQWAQGWAAYANMYAALLIMALLCSGLITVLFRLRDRLLSWQKGLVRW